VTACGTRRAAAPDDLGERDALHELHDERANAARLLEPVHLRDVRMIERREDLRLPLEAREPLRVGRQRLGEHLDRDLAIEPGVARPVDLAHAPLTDGREDFVRTDATAGGERHGGEAGL
jgi:hypothetical protein